MPKALRRRSAPASRPKSASRLTACQRELTPKRRGELAELAFTLKAASHGFGVAKPFGDSECYDVIVDSRQLVPTIKTQCRPDCLIRKSAERAAKASVGIEYVGTAAIDCPATLTLSGAKGTGSGTTRSAAPGSRRPTLRDFRSAGTPEREAAQICPALNRTARIPRGCPPHPTPPLLRVQIKSTMHLVEGLYHLDVQRQTGGRKVPYFPGEIDFLAAYIFPEDTWYLIPLAALLGRSSLLFRRRTDPKPGHYDRYKEAWHLLRP